jgi:hypothetical protein
LEVICFLPKRTNWLIVGIVLLIHVSLKSKMNPLKRINATAYGAKPKHIEKKKKDQ